MFRLFAIWVAVLFILTKFPTILFANSFDRSSLSQPSDYIEALCTAAKTGQLDAVDKLLKKGIDPNNRSEEGGTPLMYAAYNGHLAILQLLLQKGASVDAKDKDGWTALMLAAENSNITIIQKLIDNGANVNVKDSDGLTALMLAALHGNFEIVKLLVETGAHVSAQNKDGFTALTFAEQKSYNEISDLLEQQATTKAPIALSRKLQVLPAKEQLAITSETLPKKLDENSTVASSNKPIQATPPPLEFKNIPETKIENDDAKPSLTATPISPPPTKPPTESHSNSVQSIEKPPLPSISVVSPSLTNPQDIAQSGTPVVVDGSAKNTSDKALVLDESGLDRKLIESNFETPTKQDEKSITLPVPSDNLKDTSNHAYLKKETLQQSSNLQLPHPELRAIVGSAFSTKSLADSFLNAVEQGDQEKVESLLSQGADKNTKNSKRTTALMIACQKGWFDIVKLLIDKGANLDERSLDRKTALIFAVSSGSLAIARTLLKHGASINLKDQYGFNALMWAANYGHVDIVKLLINKGADATEKNNYGQTAFILGHDFEQVTKLLQKTDKNLP